MLFFVSITDEVESRGSSLKLWLRWDRFTKLLAAKRGGKSDLKIKHYGCADNLMIHNFSSTINQGHSARISPAYSWKIADKDQLEPGCAILMHIRAKTRYGEEGSQGFTIPSFEAGALIWDYNRHNRI